MKFLHVIIAIILTFTLFSCSQVSVNDSNIAIEEKDAASQVGVDVSTTSSTGIGGGLGSPVSNEGER